MSLRKDVEVVYIKRLEYSLLYYRAGAYLILQNVQHCVKHEGSELTCSTPVSKCKCGCMNKSVFEFVYTATGQALGDGMLFNMCAVMLSMFSKCLC